MDPGAMIRSGESRIDPFANGVRKIWDKCDKAVETARFGSESYGVPLAMLAALASMIVMVYFTQDLCATAGSSHLANFEKFLMGTSCAVVVGLSLIFIANCLDSLLNRDKKVDEEGEPDGALSRPAKLMRTVQKGIIKASEITDKVLDRVEGRAPNWGVPLLLVAALTCAMVVIHLTHLHNVAAHTGAEKFGVGLGCTLYVGLSLLFVSRCLAKLVNQAQRQMIDDLEANGGYGKKDF